MKNMKTGFFSSRKLFSVLLLVLIATGFSSSALSQTTISDCSQFPQSPSGDYEVTSDLDCSNRVINPQAVYYDSVFDGNGHTVYNLSFKSGSPYFGDYAGWMRAAEGSIEHIRFKNLTFEPNDGDRGNALVANSQNFLFRNVTIEDSYFKYPGNGVDDYNGILTTGVDNDPKITVENVSIENTTMEHTVDEVNALPSIFGRINKLEANGLSINKVTVKDPSQSNGLFAYPSKVNITNFRATNIDLRGGSNDGLFYGGFSEQTVPKFYLKDSLIGENTPQPFGSSDNQDRSNISSSVYVDQNAGSSFGTTLPTQDMIGFDSSSQLTQLDFPGIWREEYGYPRLIYTQPSDLRFSLTITGQSSTEETETMNVYTDVGNTGTVEATENVTLEIDGIQEDRTEVNLSPGQTKNVSLNWTPQISDRGNHNARVYTDYKTSQSVTEDTSTVNVQVSSSYEYPSIQSSEPANNTVLEFIEAEDIYVPLNYTADISTETPNTVEAQIREEGDTSFTTFNTTKISSDGTYNASFTYPYSSYNSENYHEFRFRIFDEYNNSILEENITEPKRYELKELSPPKISSFNINPAPENNLNNENYDISLNGDVGAFDIEKAEIKFYVDNALQGTETFSLSNNSGSFSLSQQDYYSYDSNNDVKDLKWELKVNDSEGNTDTAQVTGIQADEPTFNFANPPNDTLYTTNSDQDVQFEYGGDTKESGDWVLYLNSVEVDRTSDVGGSNTEGIYTENGLTPPFDGIWTVRFDSSSTGNVYNSGTAYSFYVRETPVNVVLNSPNDQATYNADFGNTVTPTFDWSEDSQGFSGTYSYDFTLIRNSDSAKIQNDSGSGINGGNIKTRTLQSTPVGSGSYTWKVEATDGSSTDVEQRSFTVQNPPVFSQNIEAPNDGKTFTVPLSQQDRDVQVNYTVDAETEDVTTELKLDGSVVETRTTFKGQNSTSYTANIPDVSLGSHTLQLNSTDNFGNSKTTSNSFDIQQSGGFSLSIDKPSPGSSFETPVGKNIRDVNSSFSVDVGSADLDVNVSLNGNVEAQKTYTNQNSNQSFNVTLKDLQEKTHNLELKGIDAQGNVKTKTVSFDVVSDSQPPTITEFTTTPDLDKVNQGDDLDVFFKGVKGSDEIDYVNVTFRVNGTVEKNQVIPADQLVEGSFLKQLNDFVTIQGAWLGQSMSLSIDVVDTAQRVADSVLSTNLGENRNPVPILHKPEPGYVETQEPGNVQPVRFNFSVKGNDNSNYYNFWILDKEDTGNFSNLYTLIEGGVQVGNDTTENFEKFVDLNSTFGQQFGNFTYYVEVYDAEKDEFFQSNRRTFEVRENTSKPVINLYNPSDNEVVYAQKDTKRRDVQFKYDVDISEPGEATLTLNGREIHDKDFKKGFDVGKETENLGLGTYKAVLSFDSENYQKQVVNRFEVKEAPNDTEDNFVQLESPAENADLYQNVGERFSWRVKANATGNTTAYIEDSGGNVVRKFEEDYTRVSDEGVYFADFNNSVSQGNYQWYADLELEGEKDLQTGKRNFTVNSFQRPQLDAVIKPKNNSVFNNLASVNFTVESETFDDSAEVKLKIREEKGYRTQTILSETQNPFSVETFSEDVTFRSPGRYVWFVEWSTNPTFTSEDYVITIKEANPQDADIQLNNPKQNDTFSIQAGQNSTKVDFNYDVEVFTNVDSTVELLRAKNSTGLNNFSIIEQHSQNSVDGVENYIDSFSLEEGSYFYKVKVNYPNSTEFESSKVGFAVGTNNTAPKPGTGEGGDGEGNFLTAFFAGSASFIGASVTGLGGTSLFVLGSIITMLSAILTSRWTDHSEIAILSSAVSAVTFVFVGWFEAWVGIILFLISAAIFIVAVRKTHGGF